MKEVILFYLKLTLILFWTSSTIIIFLVYTVICCYYVPQNWIWYIIPYIKRERKNKKKGTKYFGKGSNKNNPLHSFPVFKFSLSALFCRGIQCNAMTWMMFTLSHNKPYYNVVHHCIILQCCASLWITE